MGLLNGKITRMFCGITTSMRYVCQEQAWVDQRVFKHWTAEAWKPFAIELADKTYVLMPEFLYIWPSHIALQSKNVGNRGITL